ncbi:MAG: AEC family transporter [Lachnospiraceae bacterium]|nr:AEC family transporter [Lachnospiraceae bacterium]MDE6980203.1 AEC family transporter [Lachnospiraceae bacterium]
MNVQIILSQMLMLFAMMLIGYFLWKKQWLDEPANQKLSKIVVNIFNPMLVVYGVLGKSSGKDMGLVVQNLFLMLLFYLLLIVFGILFVWILRPKKSEGYVYWMMTIFPNVGFMGIPVISSIFGMESVIYIAFYMLGYNLLLYTLGIVLARKAAADREGRQMQEIKQGGQWKRIFNVGVLASITAILIFMFQISVPAPVVTFFDYMGNATIPLSMILIGVSIAKADMKNIFTNVKMYFYTGIRMILFPILVISLMKGMSFDPVVFGVFALELAMPVGSIITLIAKENGADETCSTNGIVLSTLVSILTIPIVCMFL